MRRGVVDAGQQTGDHRARRPPFGPLPGPIDHPDRPTFVATRVSKEGELLSIGRPARRHASLGAGGELIERLLLDGRAVDLEVAGLVPAERDLIALRREIDRAEIPVDVGRAHQIFDRDALEARAERPRTVRAGYARFAR